MQPIVDFIKTIKETGNYFTLISIENFENLKRRIRNQFEKTLGIDAMAIYSKNERHSHQEKVGFYRILDDYRCANNELDRVKGCNIGLMVLRPFVYIFVIVPLVMILLAATDTLEKSRVLLPFLTDANVPLVFEVFSFIFIGLVIVSVMIKTIGEGCLHKISDILTGYDFNDSHLVTVPSVDEEIKENIEKSADALSE